MIKSKDLRIENIVKDGIVRAITHRHVTVYNTKTKSTDDRLVWLIEPEPLTEEWLLNFGFKIHSDHSYRTFVNEVNWSISMWMEGGAVAGFEETGVCYVGENYTAVRFVHSLQNLYFALTNKELTLTK